MTRLLVATPLYPPDSGGPATDASLLERNLPAHGFESAVYSFGAVRHLPSGVRHLRYALGLLSRARGASAIVALDTFSVCLPAVLAAKLLRVPLVVRVPGDFAWEQAIQHHGVTDSVEAFQRTRYGFAVELTRRLQKAAVRSATLVVVPSDFFFRIVSCWGIAPGRMRRIYLGIRLDEPATSPVRVPEGRILFSAGRLVPWKGFGILLELMPSLPDWHLVIAGEGPLRPSLERRARELGIESQVTFAGALPHGEVLGWYRRAHAFALNSSFESFSFQVLEAMAAGIPAIATRIGSIPELLADGTEGVLCEPNDRMAFLSAIQSTQREAGLWQERTRAAQRKARQFSIEASVAVFAEALKEVCA